MRPRRPRVTGLFATLLLGLGAAGAAPPGEPEVSGSFGERFEVEVVNVDVIVTDRAGRPVTDLARDEFELLVDRRPVAIEYFAAPPASAPSVAQRGGAASGPAAPEPEAPAPSEPSRLVIFVDQSALTALERRRAVAELRRFLRARPPSEDEVMLAAFGDGLNVLAAPTTDPATLGHALDELERLPGRGAITLAERVLLAEEVRGQGAMRMAGAPAWAAQNEADRLRWEIETWAEHEIDRQRRALDALAGVVAALGAREGRKGVVLVGAGFATRPADYLLQLLDGAQSVQFGADPGARKPRAELDRLALELAQAFQQLVRSAQNARVAFYAVTPRATEVELMSAADRTSGGGQMLAADPAGGAGQTSVPRDPALGERAANAFHLALTTGGGTLALDGALAERLEKVADDAEASYSLGFTTGPAAGWDDHAIEVRATRPGLDVRHRASFRRRSAEDRAHDALLAATTLGDEDNPLAVALAVGAPDPTAGRAGRIVPLEVRIPLRSLALLPQEGVRRGRLAIRVAIVDPKRRLVLGPPQAVEIAVPEAELAGALGRDWIHRTAMRLHPGAQRIAVSVLDRLAGVSSTVARAVEIAAAD